MRTKKWLIYVTVFCTVSGVLLIFIFDSKDIKLGYDLSLATFGSSLLGLIMSVAEYFPERRKTMENFWLEARNVLIQLKKAKPLVFSVPETLVFECFAERKHNRQVELYGERIAKAMDMEVRYEARDKYIAWLKENEKMNFRHVDDLETALNSLYEKRIKEDEKQVVEIINNYIELSNISLEELDNAYGGLDFLFGNSAIRKNTCEKIFDKIRDIRNEIYQETYHFELWKKGEGNFVVCATKALKVSNNLFESKISEHDGMTFKNIYQTVFDEIEDSLEDFRIKIYWSSKKEKINRHPVQSRLLNINEQNDDVVAQDKVD